MTGAPALPAADRLNGPVVVVGAGALGLGVLVPRLRARGATVAVVARTADQALAVARGGVPAIAVGDHQDLRDLVAWAGLLVVAVRPPDLAGLAAALAPALELRHRPLPVLVCDDRRAAARWFRACVAEHGDRALAHPYANVLVDHVAVRVPSASGSGSGSRIVAESEGLVEVDAGALPDRLGRGLAELGFTPVSDFSARVARKLHVFSCGHVAGAYLGRARGHRTLVSAMADEEVADGVRAALLEGQRGIAACFGRGFAGGEALRERCLLRYADPRTADTTDRVGRDPVRTLRAGDCIVGPARLGAALGLRSPALARVAAAALLAGERDPKMGELLRRDGAAQTLSVISGLRARHPFVRDVAAAYAAMPDAGAGPEADRGAALRDP